MTIILQDEDDLHAVVTADGTVIQRAEMRETRLSDGRIALDCGKCNKQVATSRFVIDHDGTISEWGVCDARG